MNRIQLLICIAGCQLVGFVGSFFTRPAVPFWYAGLQKPWFTPPSWLFGPMWVTLYLLMGIAAYLVWNRGAAQPGVRPALAAFAVQLLLNAAWSPLFFGLRSPLAGAVAIILLWLAILLTIFLFWKISLPAALLLIPYILWVTLASALNISIYLLNR
ncbi:MAG: tryptophan-rich sensory protein [Candidatus Aminicenantes bacterium]|nr:tryptophan-rich sensory protein [Candidatus Aminicenantes bacterium]